MKADRATAVNVALVAAILIPAAQKHLDVTLSISDVADLLAGALLAWHGIATFIERRWPPNPSQPAEPAQTKVTS